MLIACKSWFESLFTLNTSLYLRCFACLIVHGIYLFIYIRHCSQCILVVTIMSSLFNHVGLIITLNLPIRHDMITTWKILNKTNII